MGITFGELEKLLVELVPEDLKIEGDPYGWFGFKPPRDDFIKRIAVVVDLRDYPKDFDAVITHHRPYGKVELPTFVVHTPLDKVGWGVSKTMAELLGLEDLEVLTRSGFGHIGLYRGGCILEGIKRAFGVYPVRYHLPRKPERVAVFPGCGFLFEEVLLALRERGADILVSGDLTYHTALRLRAEGVGYIDVGHYSSEKPGVVRLAKRLRSLVPEGVEVEFVDWGEV